MVSEFKTRASDKKLISSALGQYQIEVRARVQLKFKYRSAKVFDKSQVNVG